MGAEKVFWNRQEAGEAKAWKKECSGSVGVAKVPVFFNIGPRGHSASSCNPFLPCPLVESQNREGDGPQITSTTNTICWALSRTRHMGTLS